MHTLHSTSIIWPQLNTPVFVTARQFRRANSTIQTRSLAPPPPPPDPTIYADMANLIHSHLLQSPDAARNKATRFPFQDKPPSIRDVSEPPPPPPPPFLPPFLLAKLPRLHARTRERIHVGGTGRGRPSCRSDFYLPRRGRPRGGTW